MESLCTAKDCFYEPSWWLMYIRYEDPSSLAAWMLANRAGEQGFHVLSTVWGLANKAS